jgi:ubiquinone biosynthesis protein
MRGPHNIFRLARVVATFFRCGAVSQLFSITGTPFYLRLPINIVGFPLSVFGINGPYKSSSILRALIALGPAYIKFGQLLSTRPDIVGNKLAEELKVLQDSVDPFNISKAKEIIKKELGFSTEDLFSSFSESVAAASIAQVHRATVKSTGEVVAVKILRPKVEKVFLRDLNALFLLAKTVEFIFPNFRRLKPTEVVNHFERLVHEELDLRMEIAAAAEFSENTKKDKNFYVPRVLWGLSGRRVVTTEWVEGIPLGDVPRIRRSGVNMEKLSKRIIKIFLTQALRDGLFHGDMHQGNLKCGKDGTLIVMDFGIMGRIDEYTRRVYAEILIGFLRRDYKRVAEVHFEAGYVSSKKDVNEFAQALRSVGEPIFGMEAADISMARLLSRLFEVTEQFGMETRTELLLLQRTMVVVEGVSRSLDPNLNMWETTRPVVEKYIAENLGPKAFVNDIGKILRISSKIGPHLPNIIDTFIKHSIRPLNKEVKRNMFSIPVNFLLVFGAGFGIGGIVFLLSS